MLSKGRNRVSPLPETDGHEIEMNGRVPSGDGGKTMNESKERARVDDLRKRVRRKLEAGTEGYGDYVDKLFNRRQVWTPHLGQRLRDKMSVLKLHPTSGWAGWKHRQSLRWNSAKLTWREWTGTLELWRGSLKTIEGHQGTGVVSYFVFLKWLLFLNFFIFITMFFAVVLLQVAFDSAGFSSATMGVDINATYLRIARSDNCTGRYNPEVASDVGRRILDFLQGTGWMEKTAFFYGYYGNSEVALHGGTKYNIPLAYFTTTVVILVVSLIAMVHHMLSTYMDALMSSDDSQHRYMFNFLVFTSWDYRVCEAKPTTLQHRNKYHLIRGDIEEVNHEEKKALRTSCQRCCVWFTRIVVNVSIIILLVGAAAGVYFAQTFSLKFTTSLKSESHHALVVTLVEYLPSLIIAVLNGIFPVCFSLLVKLEDYTPAFVVRITILRIVFVRLVALAVITVTVYVKITCTPTDDCLMGQGACFEIPCWETYVGQLVYKLTITEFLADVLITFVYELPRKLITTKCACGVARRIGPAVFDIPTNVLDLVYAQALCWLGFFFAPLLPAMCIMRLIILFYLRKLSALYNTVPPERPYQAARSNAFFMVTLMIAFCMICIPIGYVLVQLQPSPMCGPFRIYEQTTDIFTIQIDNAADWFRTAWGIVTSSAIVAVVIILMALGLYYCHAMRSASTKTIQKLREHILQGEKDKQYLLTKLGSHPIEKHRRDNDKVDGRHNNIKQMFRDTMYKPSGRSNNKNNKTDNSMKHGPADDVNAVTSMPGAPMKYDYDPGW